MKLHAQTYPVEQHSFIIWWCRISSSQQTVSC